MCQKSFDRLKWCFHTRLRWRCLTKNFCVKWSRMLPCIHLAECNSRETALVRTSPEEWRGTTLRTRCAKVIATVHCLRRQRCNLEGAHSIVVFIDHNPNVFPRAKTELSRRQARWSERLQSYDFRWESRSARTNLADSLSRIDGSVPLPPSVTTTPEPRRGREGGAATSPGPTTMQRRTLLEILVGFPDSALDVAKTISEGSMTPLSVRGPYPVKKGCSTYTMPIAFGIKMTVFSCPRRLVTQSCNLGTQVQLRVILVPRSRLVLSSALIDSRHC